MINALQKLFFFVCAAAFLALAGCASLGEETAALPIDFSGGMPLKNEFFMGTWSYEDPTISVSIAQKRYSGPHYDCDYWVADIKIADASQLRTMAANGFDDFYTEEYGAVIAKRVNAVLAIDGDYFTYTGEGYIVRQGEVFLNILKGRRDILLVDEDGDFHIVPYAAKEDAVSTIDGKKVINAFYFGPALIIDGKINYEMDLRADMAAEEGRQRMCIAQVGPLEYKCICCAGPARGSGGMTMLEFARTVAKEGVQTAYNLDGGDSCMMIFNGEKINDVENKSMRKITDIVYFASAYGAE